MSSSEKSDGSSVPPGKDQTALSGASVRFLGTVIGRAEGGSVCLPPAALDVFGAQELSLDAFTKFFADSARLRQSFARAFLGHAFSLDVSCSKEKQKWRIVVEPEPGAGDGGRLILLIETLSERASWEMERLVSMLDAHDTGLALYDEEDRLVVFNRRYAYFLSHIEADHLKGKTFEEIFDISEEAGLYTFYGLDEDFRTRRIEAHKQANGEFELRLPDSRVERIVERPTRWGGRIGLHHDISDLHKARNNAVAAFARVKSAEMRLLSAIEAMNDGFVFWDTNECLVLCNSKYRTMYPELADIMKPGVRFSDVVALSTDKDMHFGPNISPTQWVSSRVERWRSGNNSEMLSRSDGRVIRVRDIASPGIGTVGLHSDITELVLAQRDAVKANESKSIFLANMSHEIRTPLTGIIGLAELTMEETTDKEHRARAANIVYLGKGLMLLLNDILDLSKLEAGKMSLEKGHFDPRSLCERLEHIHGPLAREKGVEFRLRQVEHLAPRTGDEHRIMQILNNLLSNAIKFTSKGSVEMLVGDDAKGRLHLSVRDTGLGMTREQVSRLFLPFEQADVNTAKRYGGTGLGMSIVADLVRLMKGQVNVTSTLGAGTCVEVWLPLPKAKIQPVEQHSAQRTTRKGRVLVADDNKIVRELLGMRLEKMGLDVVTVTDGSEAVERFLAEDGAFDLLFLDINMPGHDGPATLAALRDLSAQKGDMLPPVVAVTANIMPDQVEHYLAKGFVGCVAKPFLRVDLERCIETFIPRAQSRS